MVVAETRAITRASNIFAGGGGGGGGGAGGGGRKKGTRNVRRLRAPYEVFRFYAQFDCRDDGYARRVRTAHAELKCG